jgi:hypothetical protein
MGSLPHESGVAFRDLIHRAFGNQTSSDVVAGAKRHAEPPAVTLLQRDGFPAAGTISIGPYSVLVFSQVKPPG